MLFTFSKCDFKGSVLFLSFFFIHINVYTHPDIHTFRQTYEGCLESIQSFKIDIYQRRYKKHFTQDNDTSVLLKVDFS